MAAQMSLREALPLVGRDVVRQVLRRDAASTAEHLRGLYSQGSGNEAARAWAVLWARVHALGLAPARWLTLEVAGRKSGQPIRYPLGAADLDGRWYLVPMLGERTGWVLNARAAGGRAWLVGKRRTPCLLVEVPVEQRAPILRRYLQKVPGGRPHMPLGPDASLDELAGIAPEYPAFLIARRA